MKIARIRTLAALSVAVAFLRSSKSKGAKAVIAELDETHGDAVEEADRFGDLATYGNENGTGKLDLGQFVTCCLLMDCSIADLEAGSVPCIVDGRFAVRRVRPHRLTMGPKATT